MNFVKLYRYPKTVDLLLVDNVDFRNIRTDNDPMNRNVIKLHRGVDNEIRFRVFNADRKPVGVDHLKVRTRLINIQNGELVLQRDASISPEKGFMQLRVYEGDLVDVAPGFYQLSIVGQEALIPEKDGDNLYTPFYTDFGNNIVATVEVTEAALRTPAPSYTITDDEWRVTTLPGVVALGDPQTIRVLRTKSIPASRVRNHINALHTVAVFTEGYTGRLQVYATLELQPPEQLRHWFPVDITTASDYIEFENSTTSTSFTFTANFMWLTFAAIPDPSVPLSEAGKIKKIILR